MHFESQPRARDSTSTSDGPWWRGLTRYQWFVFTVASLGWLFDTMDQQLFTLARVAAVRDLMHIPPGDPLVDRWAGFATTSFMIGWAIGGILFGIAGDRIGRAKTMMLTVLCYSAFTGLSAASQSVWDFMGWRFLTGLGVGGQFAVGVALVAEVMPDRAGRSHSGGSRRSRRSAICWRRQRISCWASSRRPGRSAARGSTCSLSGWRLRHWPYLYFAA